MSVTVWSWKDWTYGDGLVRVPYGRREDWRLSGLSPSGWCEFVRRLGECGHAITTDGSGSGPWNHHVVGVGVGHDDAEFAETGQSYAAWCENGEAFGGAWWEWDQRKLARHFAGV